MAIDDETLMAYADGELDEIRRRRVEQALESDPELRVRLEMQRRLRERLESRYRPILDEEVPARLREMLETNLAELPRARGAAPAWQRAAALAAALLLGLAIGRSLPGGGPVDAENGAIIARGELAEALDAQLASAQPPDAATRIGVSFARGDGAWCRSFERPDLSGLACREDGEWRLVTTAPGGRPQGDYRQAGSDSLIVMQAAQELMAGEPLDAEAERRARDAGWRPAAPGD